MPKRKETDKEIYKKKQIKTVTKKDVDLSDDEGDLFISEDLFKERNAVSGALGASSKSKKETKEKNLGDVKLSKDIKEQLGIELIDSINGMIADYC